MTDAYNRDVVDAKLETHGAETDAKLAGLLGPINSNIAVLQAEIKIVMLMLTAVMAGMVKLVFFP